jgi:hypothetical protein
MEHGSKEQSLSGFARILASSISRHLQRTHKRMGKSSCSHENLMACVEQRKALSRKAKPIAFLFKATKTSKTIK